MNPQDPRQVPQFYAVNQFGYPQPMGLSEGQTYGQPVYAMPPYGQYFDAKTNFPTPIQIQPFHNAQAQPIPRPRSSSLDITKSNLGEFSSFVKGFLFGVIIPLISVLISFGFEASELFRLGSLFANAATFFFVSTLMIGFALNMVMSWEYYYDEEAEGFWIAAGVLGLFFLVFIVIAIVKWRRYIAMYEDECRRQIESDVKIISPLGKRSEYWTCGLVSFFFPLIGTSFVILLNKNIYARYGAMKGFALSLLIAGLLLFMSPIIFILGGNVLVFFGFTFFIMASVHFERAIIVANVQEITLPLNNL